MQIAGLAFNDCDAGDWRNRSGSLEALRQKPRIWTSEDLQRLFTTSRANLPVIPATLTVKVMMRFVANA
jgi:hypothetical protein